VLPTKLLVSIKLNLSNIGTDFVSSPDKLLVFRGNAFCTPVSEGKLPIHPDPAQTTGRGFRPNLLKTYFSKARQLQNHEWPQLAQAIATVSGVNLHVDDTPGISATEIVARCRRLKSQYGQLGCIVIDYLQLMVGEGGKTTRNLELAAISRRFKLMTTELDVPVIVLSQLNRNLEQRSNKRPTLSDLRDTSALGQDADVVIGLYRDEIHHSDSQTTGEVEVIAIKHRDGELGTVKLLFDGPHVRFRNLAK